MSCVVIWYSLVLHQVCQQLCSVMDYVLMMPIQMADRHWLLSPLQSLHCQLASYICIKLLRLITAELGTRDAEMRTLSNQGGGGGGLAGRDVRVNLSPGWVQSVRVAVVTTLVCKWANLASWQLHLVSIPQRTASLSITMFHCGSCHITNQWTWHLFGQRGNVFKILKQVQLPMIEHLD